MTNGDMIRSMNNKELAKYLSNMMNCDECICGKLCDANQEDGVIDCNDIMLEFLESEVK